MVVSSKVGVCSLGEGLVTVEVELSRREEEATREGVRACDEVEEEEEPDRLSNDGGV